MWRVLSVKIWPWVLTIVMGCRCLEEVFLFVFFIVPNPVRHSSNSLLRCDNDFCFTFVAGQCFMSLLKERILSPEIPMWKYFSIYLLWKMLFCPFKVLYYFIFIGKYNNEIFHHWSSCSVLLTDWDELWILN